ncbi:hypothetical protein [Yersinia enterocolitica]
MNNLDELSKPVAEVNSKYGDPEAFGERELKVLVDIQEMPYETKFYSQEYVTALIAQLEAANEKFSKPVVLPAGYAVRASLSCRMKVHNQLVAGRGECRC